MNCDDLRERLPDYWGGTLPPTERFAFQAHLDQCESCRQEAKDLGALWDRLGMIPAPEPTPEMRARFYQTLDAYRHGMAAAKPAFSLSAWLTTWWPRQPLVQVAVSFAMLAVGVGIGYLAHRPGMETADLATLRGEVQSMRQMVTLSLLQQQSPSERLRGVNFAYQVPQNDTEVLSALLFTVNHDANTNVRLAAVDALRIFSASPVTRRGIAQAMSRQDSPLVQIALIDLLVELKEKPAAEALRALGAGAEVNPEVKQRVAWALSRLN